MRMPTGSTALQTRVGRSHDPRLDNPDAWQCMNSAPGTVICTPGASNNETSRAAPRSSRHRRSLQKIRLSKLGGAPIHLFGAHENVSDPRGELSRNSSNLAHAARQYLADNAT